MTGTLEAHPGGTSATGRRRLRGSHATHDEAIGSASVQRYHASAMTHVDRVAFPRTVFLAWFGVSGCGAILELDTTQCQTDADCEARGLLGICDPEIGLCEPAESVDTDEIEETGTTDEIEETGAAMVDPRTMWAGEWDCIGQIQLPQTVPGAVHRYRQSFVDLATRQAPEGLAVRLCAATDLPCATPLAENIPVADGGVVEVEVSSGFDGYLEATAPNFIPMIFPLAGPIVADRLEIQRDAVLASEVIRTILLSAVDIEQQADRGIVLMGTRNCWDERAAGVQLRVDMFSGDDLTRYVYFNGELPDPNVQASDATGGTAAINVLPGFAGVQTILAATGQIISSQRMVVRPGWFTYGFAPPTP